MKTEVQSNRTLVRQCAGSFAVGTLLSGSCVKGGRFLPACQRHSIEPGGERLMLRTTYAIELVQMSTIAT
jgi:hypothetical protein